MKRFLLVLISLTLCNFSFATDKALHAPDWVSAVSFGGVASDSGIAVKVDRSGNRYVTGYFSAKAKFGRQTLTSTAGSDIFLAKFSAKGRLRWVVKAGGPGDDAGTGVDVDRKGNVYVTGWFVDSATFGSGNDMKTVKGIGETIFVAKYRPSGALAWVHTGTASDSFRNRGHSLAVEPRTGTLYVTGVSQMSTTFSSSDGAQYSVQGPWTWHMFLVKYDTAGNFKWGAWNEASPNTVPRRVAVDAHDNAYVTGWLEGTTTFYGNNGVNQTVQGLSGPVQDYPDYPGDAFLAKYDSHGNVKWVNQVGGYKGHGTSVAISNDGRVSMTGYVGNINYGSSEQAVTIATSQPGGKNINLGGGHYTDPYNSDIVVTTYDLNGVLLKARRIGAAGHDAGTAIAYNKSTLYVAGVFQGLVKADGTITSGEDAGLIVLKFGSNGITQAKTAVGAGITEVEENPALCTAQSGSVSVTGAYRGTMQFGRIKLQSVGMEDIFFAQVEEARR